MSAFFFVVCVPREEHEQTIRKRILERNSNTILKQDTLKSTINVITEIAEDKISQNKSSLNVKFDNSNNLPKYVSPDVLNRPHNHKIESSSEPVRDSISDEKSVKKRFTVTKSKSDDLPSLKDGSKGISECDATKGHCGDVKRKTPKKDIKDKQKTVNTEKQEKIMDAQTPLETVMTEVLRRLNIKDAVWCPGRENKYYQVFFSLDSGAACEEALQLLGAWGVGTRYRSALSVIPCALHYSAAAVRVCTPAPCSLQDEPNCEHHDDDELDYSVTEPSAWQRFVLSIKSRLTVAQAAEVVRADAALTFDWLFLLLVAAFAAAMGLVENSAMFLVASMLISPLMGPIMAGTFGTAIRDRSLLLMGVLHEMFGLLLALIVGFLFGLFKCLDGLESLPTTEMTSRGEERSLWVGALVAVPSGAAVAIALLGDNTASLVGVAISASLLPPAVNAGLLWALALMPLFYEADLLPNGMKDSSDLARKGAISLALTLVNIVCVYIGGLLVYKIKEVYPITSEQYWRYETGETSSSTPAPPPDDPDKEDQWPKRSWRVVEERMHKAGVGAHATWSAAPPEQLSRPRAHAADLEAYCRQRRAGVGPHLDIARQRNLHQQHAHLTHRNLMNLHGGLPRHSICAQSNIHRVPTRGVRQTGLSHIQERLRSNSQIYPLFFPGQPCLHDLPEFTMPANHSELQALRMPRSRSSSLQDNQSEEYRYRDDSISRCNSHDSDAMSRSNWSSDSGAGQLATSQTSSLCSVVDSTDAITEPPSNNNKSSKFKVTLVDEYTSGKC